MSQPNDKRPFKGFSPGKDHLTAIPSAFFSDLLPMIDNLAELKILLFCFWALPQREGRFAYLRWEDFTTHAPLMDGLQAIDPLADANDLLRAGLDSAVKRGALLAVEIESPQMTLYFANTERGRQAAETVRAGGWQAVNAENPVEILPERPNIYKLYEQNIGALTPMIAEELKDAEQEFPAAWIEDAIKISVQNNKRSLRYIRAILERWQKEGRDDESGRRSQEAGNQFITGKYAGLIEH